MPNYIAVDVGAESGRLMVGQLTNGVLTVQEAYRFSNGPVGAGGRLHWDALRLFAEIKTGLAIIAKEFGREFDAL
ncbi:MAG: rhamnulokinase, partial [Anaerolineales bacterium]